MKKGFLAVVLLFWCSIVFVGCIKNTPYTPTTQPSMTASIGSYHFVASSVVPATLDTQLHDTTTSLYILGKTSDPNFPDDKMELRITNYNGLTGVFSIVAGQADAFYWHGYTSVDPALGGIVAITKVSSNTITGYFNFNTAGGMVVTNGAFTVNKP